jgi:hypothetical protein
MAWVAIDLNIANDPAVHRIAAALRIRIPEAVGLLVLAFASMVQHAPDGRIGDVPDTLLEQWARWHGKRGAFAAQFRAELTDETGQVRAWEKWNGNNLRRLDAARERARVWRESRDRERDDRAKNANGTANGTHTGAGTSTHTERVAYTPTEQNRTEQNNQLQEQERGADAPPRPPAKVPKPRPALPAWAGRIADEWARRVGVVSPIDVAKLLKHPVEQRDEGTVLAAMHGWLDARKESKSDPKLKWFAEVAIAWADRVAAANSEPLLDNGWMSPALERETRP